MIMGRRAEVAVQDMAKRRAAAALMLLYLLLPRDQLAFSKAVCCRLDTSRPP